jgi:hypothetical protein
MIGVDVPQLGSLVFQTTLVESSQVVGRSCAVVLVPFKLGPRQCGPVLDRLGKEQSDGAEGECGYPQNSDHFGIIAGQQSPVWHRR